MSLSLTEILPHTGFGAALFPYLNELDLQRLKRTCKTLKKDVEIHVSRYGAAAPVIGLRRQNGVLSLSINGKLYDVRKHKFYCIYCPQMKIMQEEYDRRAAAIDARYGKGDGLGEFKKDELRDLLERGYVGYFDTEGFRHEFPSFSAPLRIFQTKKEFDAFQREFRRLLPAIQKEQKKPTPLPPKAKPNPWKNIAAGVRSASARA